MKHTEKHTYTLAYDKNIIDVVALIEEIRFFKKQWTNAHINYHRMGEVSISYEGFSNCKNIAYEAALQFQNAIKRHEWWSEV